MTEAAFAKFWEQVECWKDHIPAHRVYFEAINKSIKSLQTDRVVKDRFQHMIGMGEEDLRAIQMK